jgi:hypothetical protein
MKFFTSVIYWCKVRVFVSGESFRPSLLFAGEAGAYPTVEHLKDAPLGYAPADCIIKLFTSVIYWCNKLECLSLASLSGLVYRLPVKLEPTLQWST